ncbi:hypothetical protein ACWGKQ_17245 [Streptomyces sp. NPDC054770]
MYIHSRAVRILAITALTAGGLTAAGTATATAAPSAAESCYGSAKSYTTSPSNWWPAGAAWAYTTSNCADINVKPNTDVNVKTCFDPTSGDSYCNASRKISAGTWGLAATNVSDGTKFFLQFDRSSSGIVAY